MKSLTEKLAAFQRSRGGLFVHKVMDDQTPNLAALLAWGTLSALLPLVLGILTVAGLVLRDPERLNQVYDTVMVLVPSQATGPLSEALEGVRHSAAAPAGIIAILLLLFNGSSFFSNMASVFDKAYHVESRNFIMQRVVSIVMLIVTTSLLVISTLALGVGSLVQHVPLLPIGPVLASVASWSISIVSAFLLFLLLYKVLPTAAQGWRNVLPGTLLSAVVFLVFTFWLYLLGFVFVLGAELNAFLQEPARATALAEATANAEQGRAEFDQRTGQVQAESTGTAPALRGGGPLGVPSKCAGAQLREQGQSARTTRQPEGSKPSLAGRILGFIALILAVMLLRGKECSPRPLGERGYARAKEP